MAKKVPKEYRELEKAAREQGWIVKETSDGFQFLAPDGEHAVTIHMTERNPERAVKRTISRMKKYGFKWEDR